MTVEIGGTFEKVEKQSCVRATKNIEFKTNLLNAIWNSKNQSRYHNRSLDKGIFLSLWCIFQSEVVLLTSLLVLLGYNTRWNMFYLKLTWIWSGSNACCWWVVCHRPKHVSLFFVVDMVLPKRSVCDCRKRLFACGKTDGKQKQCNYFHFTLNYQTRTNEKIIEYCRTVKHALWQFAIAFYCYYVNIGLIIKTVQFDRNFRSFFLSHKILNNLNENNSAFWWAKAFTKLRNLVGQSKQIHFSAYLLCA